MIEIRDRLGDTDADIDLRLTEIEAGIATLNTTVGTLDQSALIDEVEEILNGVGVILGAPDLAPT